MMLASPGRQQASMAGGSDSEQEHDNGNSNP
jgi:hypothetical protein